VLLLLLVVEPRRLGIREFGVLAVKSFGDYFLSKYLDTIASARSRKA
jgi:hypothetical protein